MSNPTSQSFLHISDLHAGGPFRRKVGEALLEAAQALNPMAVVVSGDLVQRCELRHHWRQIEAYLERFRPPLLVVPGNHDLPVFDPLRRLLHPLKRYRAHVHQEVERVLSLPGITIVGVSTPKRWTVDLGYVSEAQRAWLRATVAASPEDSLRVAVLHHGLRQQPVGVARNHLHDSTQLIRELAQAGVQLVLSGHNHFPHVEVLHGDAEQSFVWSQAGTATSDRLRSAGFHTNSFSLVRSYPTRLEIEWWGYEEEQGTFAKRQVHGFERRGRAMRRIPSDGLGRTAHSEA